MKLVFFLIALILVSVRVYYSWAGYDRNLRGESSANMIIKSDNFYEEIRYSGKFELNDEETDFRSISPGGYFKFRLNELRVKAESNLKGEIAYTVTNDNKTLVSPLEQKKFIADAIRQMIWLGFDAKARMERVYSKGGIPALLSAVDSIKMDNIKVMYFEKMISSDSNLMADLPSIIAKIGMMNDNFAKVGLLKKFTAPQFADSSIAVSWFLVLDSLNSDMDKTNGLRFFLETDTCVPLNESRILKSISQIGSEMDQASMYQEILNKGMMNGNHFDQILTQVSSLNSDMDKTGLYRFMIEKGFVQGNRFEEITEKISVLNSDMDKAKLFEELAGLNGVSEPQWIILIDKISLLNSDVDKTPLLMGLSGKMPKTDAVKTAYVAAAKTIHNDMDYGRVMRAIN